MFDWSKFEHWIIWIKIYFCIIHEHYCYLHFPKFCSNILYWNCFPSYLDKALETTRYIMYCLCCRQNKILHYSARIYYTILFCCNLQLILLNLFWRGHFVVWSTCTECLNSVMLWLMTDLREKLCLCMWPLTYFSCNRYCAIKPLKSSVFIAISYGYTRVQACMHFLRVFLNKHTWMHARAHTHTHTHTLTHSHSCTHTHIHFNRHASKPTVLFTQIKKKKKKKKKEERSHNVYYYHD